MDKVVAIEDMMRVLELPVSVYNIVDQVSMHELQKRLEVFKDTVKKQRKLLAKKYHPDLLLDIDTTEKMKTINSVVDELLKMKVVQRQPRQQMVRVADDQPTSESGCIYRGTVTGGTYYY